MTERPTGEPDIALRKEHHLDICLDDQRYSDPAPKGTSLDQVQFLHQALPEVDAERLDTTQPFLNAMLRLPLMISCMTGGSGRGRSANRALAAAAQRAGIAIGLGSIRPLLQDEATFEDFHVKPLALDVPVLANLGAVQLRDFPIHTLRHVLQRLEVQALVVHLNAGQELYQPDGDRDFCGLLVAIERATAECGMPVIVKETGFGVRPALVRRLLGCGVRYVDLSGADGTNWVMVEGARLPDERRASAEPFADWGAAYRRTPCDSSRQSRRADRLRRPASRSAPSEGSGNGSCLWRHGPPLYPCCNGRRYRWRTALDPSDRA